jgi:hypothetical protein
VRNIGQAGLTSLQGRFIEDEVVEERGSGGPGTDLRTVCTDCVSISGQMDDRRRGDDQSLVKDGSRDRCRPAKYREMEYMSEERASELRNLNLEGVSSNGF